MERYLRLRKFESSASALSRPADGSADAGEALNAAEAEGEHADGS